MANITIALDPGVLQRARRKATGQGTSVNALITQYLTLYAESDPTGDALAGFLDLADRFDSGSGPAGRQWSREELYDRSRLR